MEGKDMISNSDVDKHRVSLPDSQILPSTSDPRSPSVIYNRPVFYGPHFNNVEYVNLSNSESGSFICSERSLSVEDDDEFWQVPLVGHYVSRRAHEEKILDWLNKYNPRTHTTPAGHMLRISGYGSAGKTTLAIFAAGEAINKATVLGFKKVVWLSREDRANMNDVSRKLRRMTASRSYLVILDDIEDEEEMRRLSFMRFVLVSTRRRDFGEHLSYKKTDVEVSGLTSPECKSLIEEIIGEDRMRKLCEAELLEDVLTLCEEASGFPLTVNIIASFLKKDIDRMSADAHEYVTSLRKRMEDSKKQMTGRKLHTDTEYDFVSSYAAVDASIEDLSDEMIARYHRLIIFERGQFIFPITLSVVWAVDEEDKVTDILEDLCARCLINKIGYRRKTKQTIYIIHDVTYDVLRNRMNEVNQLTFKKEVIQKYSLLKNPIPASDETFYLYFISWCLMCDEIKTALDSFCDIQYVCMRLCNFGSTGITNDFVLLEKKLTENERKMLLSYRDVVQSTLLRARAGEEKVTLMTSALLRPHDEPMYKGALKMIKEDCERPIYASYWESPKVGEMAKIMQIERVSHCDPNFININPENRDSIISHVDMNHEYHIVAGFDNKINYFTRDCDTHVASLDFEDPLCLVKFVSPNKTTCVVITAKQEPRGQELKWWTCNFNLSSRSDAVEAGKTGPTPIPLPYGELVDLRYDSNYLWAVLITNQVNVAGVECDEKVRKLYCFTTTDCIQLLKEFQLTNILYHLSNFVVGYKGRVAAISNFQERNIFFMNRDKPIAVDGNGVLAFCQQTEGRRDKNGRALLLSEDICLATIEFSFETDYVDIKETGIFNSSSTIADTFGAYPQVCVQEDGFFYHDGFSSFIVFTSFNTDCMRLIGSRVLKLPIESRQQIHFIRDKIVTFDTGSGKILTFSMQDATQCASTFDIYRNFESTDNVKHVCWSDALKDFPMIRTILDNDSDVKLVANMILTRRRIEFSIPSQLSLTKHMCITIGKNYAFLSNYQENSAFVFDLTNGRMVRRHEFPSAISDLCYSSPQEPDVVIVKAGGQLVKIEEEKDPRPFLEIPIEWKNRTDRVYVYEDCIIFTKRAGGYQHLSVLRSDGEPLFSTSSAVALVVSDDSRKVAIITEQRQVLLWDLKLKTEKMANQLLPRRIPSMMRSSRFCKGKFSPTGNKLIFGIFSYSNRERCYVFVIEERNAGSVTLTEVQHQLFQDADYFLTYPFLFLSPTNDIVLFKSEMDQIFVIEYNRQSKYLLFDLQSADCGVFPDHRVIVSSSGEFLLLCNDDRINKYLILKLHGAS